MKFAPGQLQHIVLREKIKWEPCPSFLPKSCKMAVLEGHPKKSDFFTVRFKTEGDFIMPAHTHPKDERVTVMSGSVAVGFGMDAKLEKAQVFRLGDYYVNARNEIHTVWGIEPGVIQISGIGPWEVHFVESEK